MDADRCVNCALRELCIQTFGKTGQSPENCLNEDFTQHFGVPPGATNWEPVVIFYGQPGNRAQES